MTDKLSLKSRLADGKTKEVIEELHQLTTDTDTDLHNEVVAISARFNQYAREERQNLKDTQTLNIELAHIRQAVLYIIDRFDPNLKAPPKSFLDGL